MKTQLLPVYFEPGRDSGFDQQLLALKELFCTEADFLEPLPLGSPLPPCDAVVFPQLLGEAYRRTADFRALDLPVLVLTSEFGTLSMWDWEILCYLRSEGAGDRILAPYSADHTRAVLRALGVRRELGTQKFVVYQDNPGEGMQAPIFKRFYWWETECVRRIFEKFRIGIEKRSFKTLGAEARAVPDAAAREALAGRSLAVDLPEKGLLSAMKMYLAIRRDIGDDASVQGVGINCLNESAFSDCTPCLAWNLLYEERRWIWGCEADVMAMLTTLILHRSLGAPILMTNLYPFLMGQAALKHERIAAFPEVPGDPRNYVLVAHCGFLGVVPQSFASQWTLRKKVLGIVDENAHAIDARIPEGPVTLAKLHPDMGNMTVLEAELTGYWGDPGSDCVNGGVLRVPDGHRMMTQLASHHYLLMTGHHFAALESVAVVFGIRIQSVT